MEPYRPEFRRAVFAFARHQGNFDYVKMIIERHTVAHAPGGCFVWREQGRIAAFCAIVLLNAQDALLYGMRVDPAFQGRGIATRFTRRLFGVARDAGRAWVGLNTFDHRRPGPAVRVAEKLGMKLEGIHATDVYWRLPRRTGVSRPRPISDIYQRLRATGERVFFFATPAWCWTRLLPVRRTGINRGGFLVARTPLHIADPGMIGKGRDRYHPVIVNLFHRPEDFRDLLAALLARGAGTRRSVILNYPVTWKHELRRAARAVVPGLRRGRNCWFSAWRIYGKELSLR